MVGTFFATCTVTFFRLNLKKFYNDFTRINKSQFSFIERFKTLKITLVVKIGGSIAHFWLLLSLNIKLLGLHISAFG